MILSVCFIEKQNSMSFNIAKSDKKRVIIVGGGFGGLKLANKLKKYDFQVVLVDKNNYHQFQPLIYQIASSVWNPLLSLFHSGIFSESGRTFIIVWQK